MPKLTTYLARFPSNTPPIAIGAFAVVFALLAILVLSPSDGFAQRSNGPDEVDQAELLKEGQLKDISIGDANSPVTIVEYASLTCGHCANFHTQVLPKLKEKYISTGKARIIMREFPLNARAYAASMITRCAADSATLALIDGLFETQKDWAFKRTNQEFKQALFDFTKQAGLSEADFNKCLGNNKLLNDLTAQFTKASEVFGVNATPAFFVNGKRLKGGPTFENFEKAIDPLLTDKKEAAKPE